jgi:hypothetical protein
MIERRIGWPLVGTCLVTCLAMSPRTAGADWPIARHDVARTGAAVGSSNLQTPAAYWRFYLGGALGLSQAIPLADAGSPGLAFVVGGRVVVRRVDDVPRWSSDNLAITELVGIADLDGDGRREVVARSMDQVFVFDAATGAQAWAEPKGEMGTIGAVRIIDLDGAGPPELVIQECGCCGVRSGETGFVYSFTGRLRDPVRRWRSPFVYCGGNRGMVAADFDGDGAPELTLQNADGISILDGATGRIEASSPDLGDWFGMAYCEPADVVPGGPVEILCAFGTTLAPPGTAHRVIAFAYRPQPARLDVLWSTDVGEVDAEPGLGAGWIQDLDGDGLLEVAVTGTRASGAVVTTILDTATGRLLGTLEGSAHIGAVALGSGEAVYLTQTAQLLELWSFRRDGAPPLVARDRLKDRRVLMRRDDDRALRQGRFARLLTADVDGDGDEDLFTVNTKRPEEVVIHDLASGAAIRTWQARPGAQVLAGWRDDAGQVVLSTSDGRLTTVSRDTTALIGSVRAGGYYDPGGRQHLPAAPIAGPVQGDAADEVIVTDSRRSLLMLDARDASNAAPPAVLWQIPDTTAPGIVPGLGAGGSTGLACQRIDTSQVPAVHMVAALAGDGGRRWETAVGPLMFNDVLPGNFDGDDVPDLVVQWGLTSDNALRTTAFAGSDGRALWTHVANDGITRFPSGHAITDWNGDGFDDVVFHHYRTRVLSGRDGSTLVENAWTGEPNWYFMPTLVDVDGDGAPEVSLHGGQPSLRTLARDLTTRVWTASDADNPYPYAAATRCSTGPVLVSASAKNPARLKVTSQAGSQAGAARGVVLAGGRIFTDEGTAAAAGVTLGQLTSVYAHEDLTGTGRPSAVVGSSDGWLYALDPCTLALDFAIDFRAPVGAAAFGDTDGDGLDEILVMAADGFLYGIRNAPIAGSGEVRDIDSSTGSTADVDEITTRDTLSASWDPVAGSTGYQVAVALAEGGYVSTPAWTDVSTTSITITGLPLVDNQRYVIAVRARSAQGMSPDVLSDGVLVHLPPGPDDEEPGQPAPGGCCSTSTDGRGAAAAAALVAVAITRRRRRPATPARRPTI